MLPQGALLLGQTPSLISPNSNSTGNKQVACAHYRATVQHSTCKRVSPLQGPWQGAEYVRGQHEHMPLCTATLSESNSVQHAATCTTQSRQQARTPYAKLLHCVRASPLGNLATKPAAPTSIRKTHTHKNHASPLRSSMQLHGVMAVTIAFVTFQTHFADITLLL